MRTPTELLRLQRAAGNLAVQRVVGGWLRDYRGKKRSADDIRKTREYLAYLDPTLIWQWKYRATPDEALQACWSILYHLEQGERVEWPTRAREFLLNARALLKPEMIDKPPPKLSAKHHYRVELKAWIPHRRVVDPIPGLTNSHYRGDDHAGYAGTWRVLNWVEFDWDGKKIAGFTGGDSYGASHRDWSRGPLSGTETETATGYTGRELRTESYFTMWITSKNPIPLAPAPAINSTVDVFATCSNITLVYTTDEFPSHGIQVSQDGKPVQTKVVFDASTLDGTDPSVIFLGLTEFTNEGDFEVAVPPDLASCQPAGQPPTTVPP